MDTVLGCSKCVHLSFWESSSFIYPYLFLFFYVSSVHLPEVTTHVFLSLRADEIEILMTDLERANQVARSVYY